MFKIRIIQREKDGERKRKIQWTGERKKTLNERIGHGGEEKKLNIKKEVSVNIMPSVDANSLGELFSLIRLPLIKRKV